MQGFMVNNCIFNCTKYYDIDNLEIDFDFGTSFSDEEDKAFQVKFAIEIKETNDSDFMIKIEATALFSTKEDICDDFKSSDFSQMNAPAIAFPFLRSFIQTLCVNAGIPPIILPSFNFAKAKQ